ncbi:MAG: DNA gyrase inhibitor YacG [Deltaproteobacteria bacterium]|nr:MAG: DNA gyrase inhibitor YacG [Deltaproteobacteria bacterium]
MKVKCPTCKGPAAWGDNPYRPFCSERCRLIDLGRWLDEDYRIEGEEDETDETSPPPGDYL